MGPLPVSLCCGSSREHGCTLGWQEAQAVGAVGWGQGPLPRELLAMGGGYFHTATRTLPPRSRPLPRGLCSPPTPATRFSRVWWRAARPWMLSGSWRTGEPYQVRVGAWSGRLESTGSGQGLLVLELASFPGQSAGSGCLGSWAHLVVLQEPTHTQGCSSTS